MRPTKKIHISNAHAMAELVELLGRETTFKIDVVASNVRRYPRGGPFVRVLHPAGAELFHTDDFDELCTYVKTLVIGWRAALDSIPKSAASAVEE